MNGYAEDLRQRLNYDPEPVQRQYQSAGSTVAITTNGDVVRTDNAAGQASHGTYIIKVTLLHKYRYCRLLIAMY